MKKLIIPFAFAAAILNVACTQEIEEVVSFGPKITIEATNLSPEGTRTTLQDNGIKVYWETEDTIAVFYNGSKGRFISKNDAPALTTEFEGTLNAIMGFNESEAAENPIWGLYPYREDAISDKVSVTTTLPAEQVGRAGSFAKNTQITLARANSLSLGFYNVTGGLRFSLTQEGIKKVTFEGTNGEILAGTIKLAFADGRPVIQELTDGIASITLTAPGDESFQPGQWYYIATIPGSLANGFKMTFQKDGEYAEFTSKKTVSLKRGVFGTLTTPDKAIKWEVDKQYQLSIEREALIAIYKALNGDNWTDGYNNNWLSDKPVSEWSGVSVDENGYVSYLYLTGTGEIPSAILNLSHLKSLRINYYSGNVNREFPACILSLNQLVSLYLYGQHLIGTIPSDIGSLSNLKQLEISDTKMGGQIPESIGQLTQLEYLDFQWNQFSGELPESIGNLVKLRHFMMRRNELSGNIPLPVQKLPIWKYDWGRVILGNSFNEKTLVIPTPDINGTTMDGGLYSYNSQTEGYHVLIQWSAQYDAYLVSQISALNHIYTKYNSDVSFVGLISSSREESKESVETYISEKGISWPNIYWTHENNVIEGQELAYYGISLGISRHEYAAPCFPAIFVFHNGKVVYWDLDVYGGVSGLDDYLSINVLGETPNYYISTDYSKDGQVTTKKTASVGNGINLILMGDAFSDRQIADGTYAGVLDRIVDSFFSVEPYSSFREFFNIYYVNVVSATEGYDHDGQALNTFFGSGTFVGGNNSKCIEYALKAISEQYMDDALIFVAMNKDTYAGTCHMTTAPSGNYGRGLSIAYFPTSSDADTFNGLVSHEAGGHGFAKLADEYAYEYMGAVPQSEIDDALSMATYGWWKNVDFTSNPSQVKWSQFLSDPRYANEGLGCYEGGLTYWTGVWRPTENSIMRYNTGGFNAPSRYAIWYRIGKLAYGENWEGRYEDFVAYDQVNRTPAAVQRRNEQARRQRLSKPLPPLAPPVIIEHSWREEQSKAK